MVYLLYLYGQIIGFLDNGFVLTNLPIELTNQLNPTNTTRKVPPKYEVDYVDSFES